MIIDLGILTIKVDVLIVQIINIALLLMFFKKIIGNTLADEVEKRKAMTLKLEQADREYASLLADANAQKEWILSEALAHKKKLLEEAKEIALHEKDKILWKAKSEADSILDKAKKDADIQARDLDSNFIQWVKTTSLSLVKKLFASKKDIQESYLQGLVEEFSASYKK
jgi:F0F1-type ATP synthase membrane subunit b/b'